MTSQRETLKKFIEMDSSEILKKIASGNIPEEEAAIAAFILENRYPTPDEWKRMRIAKNNRLTAIRKNMERVEKCFMVMKRDIEAIEEF